MFMLIPLLVTVAFCNGTHAGEEQKSSNKIQNHGALSRAFNVDKRLRANKEGYEA